ncbi:metalloregulator ArsR/SmtB family transcription factor [Marinospirillum sp. MEB164]|uniref:Metalloregulator ArsR/SmtB family transcription factor n=1 Tax=Marinospirillum alkalitolerans TaxID=3123374 RepID=A0ABW8PX54_9GAMM
MNQRKKTVLFLCSANAARSQMAEALLRHRAGTMFTALSAGTHPEQPDPRALALLSEAGIAIEGLRSKSTAQLPTQQFDFVISLCDQASQVCRKNSALAEQFIAWDLADPAKSDHPLAFQHTLALLQQKIDAFIEAHSSVQQAYAAPPHPTQVFKLLGDPIRLACMRMIFAKGELCVCEMMSALNASQPKVSRHLAQLRQAGLLLDRRQGQWVFYQLHPLLPEWVKTVLHSLPEEQTKN